MTIGTTDSSGNSIKLVLAWGFVGIPLVWGVGTSATTKRKFRMCSIAAPLGVARRAARSGYRCSVPATAP